MNEYNKVLRMLVLISQIGITMLTSIFLCGVVGYLIDEHYGTSVTIFFILFGIVVGYRAVYALIRQFVGKDKKDKHEDSEENGFHR